MYSLLLMYFHLQYVDAKIACSVVEHSKMHNCVFLRNSISCVRRGEIFNIPQSAHVLSCSQKTLKLTHIIATPFPPPYSPHCCPLTTLTVSLLQPSYIAALTLTPFIATPLLPSYSPHCCPHTALIATLLLASLLPSYYHH
jgi:hypothetical protein